MTESSFARETATRHTDLHRDPFRGVLVLGILSRSRERNQESPHDRTKREPRTEWSDKQPSDASATVPSFYTRMHKYGGGLPSNNAGYAQQPQPQQQQQQPQQPQQPPQQLYGQRQPKPRPQIAQHPSGSYDYGQGNFIGQTNSQAQPQPLSPPLQQPQEAVVQPVAEYETPAVPTVKSKRQYPQQQYDFNAPNAPASNGADVAYGHGQGEMFIPAGGSQPQMGEYNAQGLQQGYFPGYGDQQQQQQNMNQVTNQLGQMSTGRTPSAQAPMHNMYQLQTIDLLAEAPNILELDNAPPRITLPENTSVTGSEFSNCPPEYMRSTLNAVPANNSVLKKSKLPFALVVRPYISLRDEEAPLPLVADTVISRCRRCRTYINPYVTFIDGGHRWKCNMCSLTNDVPSAFDWDSQNQRQLNRWERVELNYSVVEFLAPQEYMVRPPQPLIYIFLLDVSAQSIASGLLATAARTILESLDRIPNKDNRTRVGFIGVDNALSYFSIAPGEESEPRMMVVSDLEEPFLPVPSDLLATLSECRTGVENLLNRINEFFQNSSTGSNAMGPALKAAHRVMSSIGGKIICLMTTLPNLGTGKLDLREDKKLLGTPKESSLLQTANSFYKSFAVECSKSQITIDMFLFASTYQDVASLGNLPRFTGGQTYFYPAWSAQRPEDAIKFAHEFSEHLSMEIALEAVMRIRATTGLRMSGFYGNFFNRSSDLCSFPTFPRDQGYVVEVAIDEALGKSVVCLQTAILHTTCSGERRIRVMTLALPTTTSVSDLYSSADQCAIATYYAHKAVEKAISSRLEDAREMIQSKMVELISTYKKELTSSNVGAATPLQFAFNLRLLPLLFLSLIKHVSNARDETNHRSDYESPHRSHRTSGLLHYVCCRHCPCRTSFNTSIPNSTPCTTCPTSAVCLVRMGSFCPDP